MSGKMLVDDYPLMFSPTLATEIGLSESIVIQQIHYWLEINKDANRNFHDGYYWTFNSYTEWQEQFPFWSVRNIKRIFTSLEEKGLLIIGNYNRLKFDRTKWYRIDYDALTNLINSPKCKKCPTMVTKVSNDETLFAPTIPETTSETTTKTNKVNKGICSSETNPSYSFESYLQEYDFDNEDKVDAVAYYLQCYEEYMGCKHPNLKAEQWQRVEQRILKFDGEYDSDDINSEQIRQIIDKHFLTEYRNCDYNILHFVHDKIIGNRFYEECYNA